MIDYNSNAKTNTNTNTNSNYNININTVCATPNLPTKIIPTKSR